MLRRTELLAFLVSIQIWGPVGADPHQKSCAPEHGAIEKPGFYRKYEDFRGASRSETLNLLTGVRLHVNNSGISAFDVDRLLKVLEPLVTGQDDEIALEALLVMQSLGSGASPAVTTFQELATSTNRHTDVRVAAIGCMFAAGAASSAPVIEGLLLDDDWEVQLWAAATLALSDRKYVGRALPILLDALENLKHRREVIEVLVSLGSDAKDAAPALESLHETLRREQAKSSDLDHVSWAILRVKGLD